MPILPPLGDELAKMTAALGTKKVQHGYTERQVRRLVEWYMRVKQAG